jgi:2-polyprenyl-3-methyl-5-hydroxy-6-metoxy-1,4-benzoquinol methylase
MKLNNENKITTQKAYTDIAQKYYEEYIDDKSDLGFFDEFLKSCGHKVLDLGCGMGHYSKYMADKGFEVVGVDFSEGMLEIARKLNPSSRFINCDVCALPDSLDNDFDGVVLAFVLQHLSKEEAVNCLNNAFAHMKADGDLLVLYRDGNSVVMEEEPFNPQFVYKLKE